MGIFGSSEESIENKAIDTNGQVNNNLIIQQEAHDTHDSMIYTEKLLVASYIMIGLEVFKIGFWLFGALKRNIKKKYQEKRGSKSNNV